MVDRRGMTMLDDLPEDIIIDQILIRLAPKDIGHCRVARRSWRSATHTPKFILDHHQCQPSLAIIDGGGNPSNLVIFHGGHAGEKSSSKDLWPFSLHPDSKFRLHASCDGFLIASHGGEFYICNPIIRQQTLLPQPQYGQDICNTIIGLYRHQPSGEYRLLWVSMHFYKGALHEVKSYILKVGSNQPRCISVEIPTLSIPLVEQKFRLSDLGYCCNLYPAVYHHAKLHWCPYRFKVPTDKTGKIVVFDTMDESYRWMQGPYVGFRERLLDMKGSLAIASCPVPDSTVINVWVMHDYNAQIWSFKYRIDVSMIEASGTLGLTSIEGKKGKKQLAGTTVKFFNDIVGLNESELLIGFNSKYVLHCNIDGKLLEMVSINKMQYCMDLTRYCLKESIMPIPSSRMEEENAESQFAREVV